MRPRWWQTGDVAAATITLDAEQFGPEALQGLMRSRMSRSSTCSTGSTPTGVQTAARRPRGSPDWPQVGIFAYRAKGRPNCLGFLVCRLLAVQDLTVTVYALDAIDGTPVLDLKPYMAEFAPRGQVHQPAWSR